MTEAVFTTSTIMSSWRDRSRDLLSVEEDLVVCAERRGHVDMTPTIVQVMSYCKGICCALGHQSSSASNLHERRVIYMTCMCFHSFDE
jgi:hypothetical protein